METNFLVAASNEQQKQQSLRENVKQAEERIRQKGMTTTVKFYSV